MAAQNLVSPTIAETSFTLKRGYAWLAWLFIIAVIVVPRLLDLDVFFARDELAIWTWVDQYALAVWDLDPAATLTTSDYPGIPMYWVQTLFLTIKYNFPALFPHTQLPVEQLFQGRSLEFLAERRAVGALFVSLQIILAVWLLRRLFGWPVALLAAILLGLDPFSLTEARLLRLEMISAYFVCLTILTYLIYLRWRRRRWVIMSGVMAGLGVSSKTSAGLIVPYIWLLLLLDLLLTRQPTIHPANQPSYLSTRPFKRVIGDGLLWAAGAISAFWLIWPAMWVKPLAAIGHIYQTGFAQAADRSVWGDKVFFWGHIFPGDPGPFFYPVVLAFRTTPLTWLGVAGALIMVTNAMLTLKRSGSKQPLPWMVVGTLLLLAYVVLMIVELSFVISKVDRFLLIVFPVLNIITAIGLAALLGWIVDGLGRRFDFTAGRRAALLAGAILVVLAVQLAITAPVHPYYFTYWNPLVGGGRAAMEILPMGSGEGVDEAMDFLNQQPQAEQRRLICGASQPWCRGKFAGESLRSATYVSGEWVTADYASFYISHLQRQNYPTEVVDFFMQQPPLYQVDLGNATYMWVYDIPNVGHFAGSWNELAGLGQLLGYDLGEASQPAGATVKATIWWTNTGAGVDNLIVRWLDEAGYEWGRASVAPRPEYAAIPPNQRAIVAGEAAITIPPDTPPGLYYWRIGVVEPGETRLLGEFELPDDSRQLVITAGANSVDPAEIAIPERVNQPLAPEITLLGYAPPEQVLTAEEPAWLALYWQAAASPADYEIRLRLLDRAGQAVQQWQGQPVSGRYPTRLWSPGQIIKDVWPLQVEPGTPVGQYDLELRLVDPSDSPSPTYTIPNLQVWPQPIRYEVTAMQTELNANFGDHLTLLGYDLFFDSQGAGAGMLSPVFYWQSQADFEGAFDLVLTLRAADTGQLVTVWRAPLGTAGPKTIWKAGEVVTTIYQFEANPAAKTGYHLDIALQNQADGQLVSTTLPDGSETDAVRIENIQDKIVVRVGD